ncbi:MAG: GIY-YIG nuclease family protein [Pseudomonadota bacterium]
MALNFYRINYSDEGALETMASRRSLEGAMDQDAAALALRLKRGDHVLAGRYFPETQLGHVRLVGRVKTPGSKPEIIWVPADLKLRPRSFGKTFWGKNGQFRFDDKVAVRYMLPQICEEAFLDVTDAPPMPRDDESSAQRRKATPALAVRPIRVNPGHVYVIKSPYGYKIGKSRRLRDRVQLFNVKLPFPIEVIVSGWCEDYTLEETELHGLFHAKRLEGEWFDLNESDLELLKNRLIGKEPEVSTSHDVGSASAAI